MTRQDSVLFLVVLGGLVALAGLGCAGGSASYTRFRRGAVEGYAPRPEEVRASDFVAYHAQRDAPRPAIVGLGPDSSATAIEATLGNPHLPIGSPARPLLSVSLRGGAAAYRYPANIVVVIDVSGSMRDGDKIGAVRHALSRFVETLDDDDRISLVTFSDTSHVALAAARVGDARASVLGAIAQLSAWGGTNLDAGLAAGLALARSHDPRVASVTRVVLLSDGVPSVGDVRPDAIVARVTHGADRVPVHAIGMGRDIDYALLDAIGRESGGAFHYLDRPAEVERVFSTELRALTEVAARDVRVRVTLPPGWSLARALDERTEPRGREIVTRLGDLGGDEAAVVLAELEAPATFGPETLRVDVEYLDARGVAGVLARAEVVALRDASGPYLDATGGAVLRNAALARAALALRESGVLRVRGDGEGAQILLGRALSEVCSARARLFAGGERSLAASLDEVSGLVGTLAPPAPTSASFAGWRPEVAPPSRQPTDVCSGFR